MVYCITKDQKFLRNIIETVLNLWYKIYRFYFTNKSDKDSELVNIFHGEFIILHEKDWSKTGRTELILQEEEVGNSIPPPHIKVKQL